MTALWRDTVATPLGELVVLAADDGLKAVEFAAADRRIERLLARRYATAEIVPLRDPLGAVTALARYFDGQLDALADLPRAAPGTAFQQRLWAVLGDIPLFGILFQRRRSSDARGELVIFITPRIINRAEAFGK